MVLIRLGDRCVDTDTGEAIEVQNVDTVYNNYMIISHAYRELLICDKLQYRFSIFTERRITQVTGKYAIVKDENILTIYEINFETRKLCFLRSFACHNFITNDGVIAIFTSKKTEIVSEDGIFSVDNPEASSADYLMEKDIIVFTMESVGIYVNYKTNKIVFISNEAIDYICDDYNIRFDRINGFYACIENKTIDLDLTSVYFFYENKAYVDSGQRDMIKIIDLSDKLGLMPPK